MADDNVFLDRILKLRNNPTGIQRIMLEEVERVTDGKKVVVSASNPFVFLMEAAATVGAAGMSEAAALNRKQYPSNANTMEELYLHMSDDDYLNIFSTPGRVNFKFLIGLDEVKNKAVPIGQTGSKKLTIPRHTRITVADVPFTLQYPIDLRVLANGGISVLYDGSRPSPVELLESNVIDWTITNINGLDFILMSIPVQQFTIASQYAPISDMTGFKKTYTVTDQFYYCRVYHELANGDWEEIRTTHTEQVYDPTVVTAALRLVDDQLTVVMPQIYLTRNMVGPRLRIDIYSTKGEINMDLNNFGGDAFSAEWIDNDKEDDGKYYSAFNTFSSFAVFSEEKVISGQDEMSFEQLRDRVMVNSLGPVNLPITDVQVEASLGNTGYDVVKELDSVTNRQFIATRYLPTPSESDGVAPATSTMMLLQSTIAELAQKDTVMDNGNRLTLLPTTVYQNVNGLISVVPAATVASIKALDADELAEAVNSGSYLYSPFHYVFDINEEEFRTRAYSLQSPEILSKYFVAENETAQAQVGTDVYDIYPDGTNTGYYVDISTKSNSVFKEIHPDNVDVQISYVPEGASDRVFMTADFISILDNDELLFRFHITTDFDLDDDDNLILTSFKTLDNSVRDLPILLDREIDIAYILSNYEPVGLMHTIPDVMNPIYLDAVATNHVTVTHEKLRLNIGERLERLWTRARSVLGPEDYETYATAVKAYHEGYVYVRDDVTGNIEYTWDGVAEKLVRTVLYYPGDAVVNAAGEAAYEAAEAASPGLLFSDWWASLDTATQDTYHVIKHSIGDVVYDGNGDPVPIVGPLDIVRQADLMLVDGKYYFATAPETAEYRESLPDTISNWIVNDIGDIAEKMLEQTELYFYPKNTVGKITAYVGEGTELKMEAEQSFNVTFHVDSDVYNNSELRAALERTAAEVINERLSRVTVSLDDITTKVKAAVGDNVISVDVSGLFDGYNVTTATLVNESARFVIGKQLVKLADGTLAVQDAVNVGFIRHTE